MDFVTGQRSCTEYNCKLHYLKVRLLSIFLIKLSLKKPNNSERESHVMKNIIIMQGFEYK